MCKKKKEAWRQKCLKFEETYLFIFRLTKPQWFLFYCPFTWCHGFNTYPWTTETHSAVSNSWTQHLCIPHSYRGWLVQFYQTVFSLCRVSFLKTSQSAQQHTKLHRSISQNSDEQIIFVTCYSVNSLSYCILSILFSIVTAFVLEMYSWGWMTHLLQTKATYRNE